MSKTSPTTEEFKVNAYWDSDERGAFPEVEVFDAPEWMSDSTIHAIEQDIANKMRENRRKK